MDQIILASSSPRRTDLLAQAGIPHRVSPGTLVEEEVELDGNPEENAIRLAYLKAADVAAGLMSGLVLGADTVVVLDGTVYGKPKNGEAAFDMLSKLSGRSHSVITGIALYNAADGSCKTAHEVTTVRFAKLSEKEIRAYMATGEPFDKAGAYAIQGKGALLVESVEGSFDNVVGLPLMALRKLLMESGFSLEEIWEQN
ncbi:MAG: septum formation inhibitor Maf [Clostridiales bacterium]|nr:septum formation inhibitor Maf [Clostridiales bacterium]